MIEPDKIQVYNAIAKIFWKSIFSIVSIVVFFMGVQDLRNASNWKDYLNAALLEALFIGIAKVTWLSWFKRGSEEE